MQGWDYDLGRRRPANIIHGEGVAPLHLARCLGVILLQVLEHWRVGLVCMCVCVRVRVRACVAGSSTRQYLGPPPETTSTRIKPAIRAVDVGVSRLPKRMPFKSRAPETEALNPEN